MGRRQSLQHGAIAVGIVGGILVGAVGALMRQFMVYLFRPLGSIIALI